MFARWRIKWFLAGLLTFLLILTVTPVSSQSHTAATAPLNATAPVVVDGRVLFRLNRMQGFSAQARADLANSVLRQVLQSASVSQPIAIKTTQQGKLTTIRANNRHLLTITASDFMMGSSSTEQAEMWSKSIQAALKQAQQERTPAYYRQSLFLSIFALVIAIAFSLGVTWLRRYLRRHQKLSPSSPAPWRWTHSLDLLCQPGLFCLQAGIWIVLGLYLTELFPASRQWRYYLFSFLDNSFKASIFTIGEQGFSLLDTLKLLALVIGLWVVVRGLTKLLKSSLLQSDRIDKGTQDAIAVVLQIILTGLGLVIILQALGINLSAIALLASVLGVGIGFGLQHIANNLISGLVILFERPIQVGDFINLGDLAGTVERIGARSSEIRTLDQVTIIVPNSEFIQSKVINWSHGHPVSRLHIPFSIADGSAIKQVRQAALEAAKTHPEVLHYPQPELRFQNFGDRLLNFDLLIWIREPRYQYKIKSDLYYLLEANLRRYQLETPPPLSELVDCVTLLPQQSLTEAEIAALVTQMRGKDGLEIKDRRYGLSFYSKCFVGSEAVDWLIQTQKATREEAMRIGQMLVELGMIHHVTDEHPFEDEHLYYRFYVDEPNMSR